MSNEKLSKLVNIIYIIFIFCGSLFLLVSAIAEMPIAIGRLKHFNKPVYEIVEPEEPVVIQLDPLQEEIKALEQIENRKEWYETYRKLSKEHPELFDATESIYDKYTEEEIYLMQRVIETETYGCDFEAKTHVASVILNRIEGDNNFPNDAISVCTAPGQFVYGRKQISEDTVLALEYAYEIEDTTNGALYFNSMAPMESWNGRKLIFTDHVGHSFY